MRKLTAALFALLLLGAIAGCNSDGSDDPDTGEQSSQAESTGDDTSDGSDDPTEDPDGSNGSTGDSDGSDDATGDDGSQDGPAGDPVQVPSDLVDDVSELAADEDEDVTEEEAACIVEMMVIVLGEDGARDAVDGGVEEIEAAMSAATDDFSDESYRQMMTRLSEDCQVLMAGDASVEEVEAPAAGPED